MKKYFYILLILLLIPIMVNAETLTYEVCESGCEYADLNDVRTAIRNLGDLTDKDIIINVNGDMSSNIQLGSINNMINSVTINGNHHAFNNNELEFLAKNITINDSNNIGMIALFNSNRINIQNSNIKAIQYMSIDSNYQIKSEEINMSEILDIDDTSLNNLMALALIGNFKIENMNFKNILLEPAGGTVNIYNSQIEKILNYPVFGNITMNIYNSKFTNLKYKKVTSYEEFENETNNIDEFDFLSLNYDIYDINFNETNGRTFANTTVYFDKESKLKPGDILNLISYLDYYTEDKEIEYTIEDESVAKIENKELTAIKEGNTNITVTTDEGHVVYNINLVVEKETIPEKIDKMTIKVPITGSKLKLWVVVVSVLLLGVTLVCSYLLIKNKKH